jgi:hypothetical protein
MLTVVGPALLLQATDHTPNMLLAQQLISILGAISDITAVYFHLWRTRHLIVAGKHKLGVRRYAQPHIRQALPEITSWTGLRIKLHRMFVTLLTGRADSFRFVELRLYKFRMGVGVKSILVKNNLSGSRPVFRPSFVYRWGAQRPVSISTHPLTTLNKMEKIAAILLTKLIKRIGQF